MGNLETSFVQEAFDTNWIAPLGPHVTEFENELSGYVGLHQAAALNSGTSALHLTLIALGVGQEDIVLCQSFTFAASANPIRYLGATPVFIDSESDTWNMDPEQLRTAIEDFINTGKKPKVVIAVNLYGMPAKLDEIVKICRDHEIPLIEDAAESLGSHILGKKAGSFGYAGILSFNGNKIITTSGGGALLSNDESFIQNIRFLSTQARDPAPHYQHSEIGYNYRMSNVLAGIGRGQMRVLDERVSQRRANYQRYREYFSKWNERGFSVEFQEEPEGYFSNRWLTAIVLDPERNHGLTREDFRLALDTENIESRPLWKPMHLQPVFADFPFYGTGVSERLFEHGLCLPSGSNLTKDEFLRIYTVLDEVFESKAMV